MFEKLKSRQGLICLGFGLWAVTTFGHFFISAPQTFQNSPRPAAARVMERTRSLLSEEVEEGVEEEEDVEVEEAGRYEAWWQEQLERRVRVAQTCVRERILERADRNTFLYDPEHRLLFCRNAKVGTSTWLQHFLSLADLPEEEEEIVQHRLHAEVPRLFSVEPRDPSIPLLAQATISFSMVRHPFERLVSAYQSKVVRSTDEWYAWVRTRLKDQFGDASFTSFAKMIVAKGKKVCQAPGKSSCGLDKHWKPFVSRCAYCTTHYTVIAKAETFKEDLRYISHLANVTFVEEVQKNHQGGMNTAQLTKKYFSQFDRSLVEELYKQYRIDFEMFGYSPQQYLDLAKEPSKVPSQP